MGETLIPITQALCHLGGNYFKLLDVPNPCAPHPQKERQEQITPTDQNLRRNPLKKRTEEHRQLTRSCSAFQEADDEPHQLCLTGIHKSPETGKHKRADTRLRGCHPKRTQATPPQRKTFDSQRDTGKRTPTNEITFDEM